MLFCHAESALGGLASGKAVNFLSQILRFAPKKQAEPLACGAPSERPLGDGQLTWGVVLLRPSTASRGFGGLCPRLLCFAPCGAQEEQTV